MDFWLFTEQFWTYKEAENQVTNKLGSLKEGKVSHLTSGGGEERKYVLAFPVDL